MNHPTRATSHLPRAARFAALAALACFALQGCVAPARTTRVAGRGGETRVKMPVVKSTVTTSDIRHASYGVIYDDAARQNIYTVAYVQKEGKVSIIEGDTGFRDVSLTSTDMPQRVKDHILMSPLVGIIGERRSFTVGETYDAVMQRPEGRPHFRYTCERRESIAGHDGYYLSIEGVKHGTREMDVIVAPNFPFPLYVKEYTGANPIQIILTGTSDRS
jgi:hypothetical protein